MTEKNFHKIFETVLSKLKNKEEYAQICKNSWDSDNSKGLTKSEAQTVKKHLELDFKIAGKERMFYKDLQFKKIQLRFMIPYGHGMLDSSYRVFSGMDDNSIPSFSYRKIVKSVNQESKNPEYTFPMNSNIEEYINNLKYILSLNEQIVSILNAEMEM